MSITYHDNLIQGSEEWHQARCGLITASEVKLLLNMKGGGKVVEYRPVDAPDIEMTAKQAEVYDRIIGRQGSVADLALIADASDSMIRTLHKKGLVEKVEAIEPLTFCAPPEEKLFAHLWELAAQRISNYVEPSYVGDDMLRGHEEEFYARQLYGEKIAPVREVGFVTNSSFGFTLGCSPDGLIGDDGMIECKSRRQKYQVQTIVEHWRDGTAPADYLLQVQTAMLVMDRAWCDLISYSGGLPMIPMRIERDVKVCEAILEACTAAETKISEIINDYHDAVRERALIPTERRVEQEMYV